MFCWVFVVACFAGTCAGESPGREEDWLAFPSRAGRVLIHRDCVHHVHENGYEIKSSETGGDHVVGASRSEDLGPCPYPPRYEVSGSGAPNSSAAEDLQAPSRLETITGPSRHRRTEVRTSNQTSITSPSYYSDWVSYAFATGNFGYMSSDWVVPKAPSSHGPVPGMSSAYLFNGLEDGGALHGKASYILQPVLSYGKSGCIIDPANFFRWYLISFSVTGAGRAYCGKRIAVDEGETVRGIMRLEDDGTSWSTISIRLRNNDTSVAKTNLGSKQPNAAYITLETMINYGCNAFPASGTITFARNVMRDRSGRTMHIDWKSVLRHRECNQEVKINSDGSVTLTWNAGNTASVVV